MSRIMTEKSKIFVSLIMCAAVSGAALICGTVVQRKSADVPAVEIIEMTTKAAPSEIKSDLSVSVTETEKEQEPLMVNINTASAEELDKLDGIGEVTANAIIEYRKDAPFTCIEDIMNVKGIGEKKFEAIKDNICV